MKHKKILKFSHKSKPKIKTQKIQKLLLDSHYIVLNELRILILKKVYKIKTSKSLWQELLKKSRDSKIWWTS